MSMHLYNYVIIILCDNYTIMIIVYSIVFSILGKTTNSSNQKKEIVEVHWRIRTGIVVQKCCSFIND